MADEFHYQPEWQGPLPGRSFEKQTEDAINRALASGTANASDATPLQAGVASPGTSDEWSRGDHIHPPQTAITGNAATATRLQNTRSIRLSGDASGVAPFNGAGDANIAVTIPNATTSQKGLMSSADKTKLDSVEAGANNYTLPQATTTTLGGVRVDAQLDGSSTNPVRNSAVKSAIDSAQGQIGQCVKLTGAQTIAGSKTFTSEINGALNGNAKSATRFATGRYIGLSGAVAAQAQVFTGESDVTIPISYLDATKLTGVVSAGNGGTGSTSLDGAGIVTKSGAQTVSGAKTFSTSPLVPDPDDASSQQAAPIHFVRDMLRADTEAQSGGRNTIARDQWGNPHVMVVIPRFNLEDIDASLGTGTHPAFIAGGVVKSEILIGKYQASKSSASKVQTLPGKAPWAATTFGDALANCKALGSGFTLGSNAAWAARALWLYKQLGSSHEYLGNTNYGRSHTNKWQTGVMLTVAYAPGDSGNGNAACLTGTGPVDWCDDGTPWGLSDLVGNVADWVGGLRIVDGEIQILPNNDAMLADADMSAGSSQWRAVLQNGSIVAPGTANTLKFDGAVADTRTSWGSAGAYDLNTVVTNQNVKGFYQKTFKDVSAVSGVTVPGLLKALGIFPIDASGPQGSSFMCNKGERFPLRSGGWSSAGNAGPFYLDLRSASSDFGASFGFRVALLP